MSVNVSSSPAFVFAFDRAICRFFCDVLGPLGYRPIDTFAPPPSLYFHLFPFQIPRPSLRALTLIERDVLAQLRNHQDNYGIYAVQIDCLDFLTLQSITSERGIDKNTLFWYSSNPQLVDVNNTPNVYGARELLNLFLSYGREKNIN